MTTLQYVAVPPQIISIMGRARYPRTVGGELTWRRLPTGAAAYYLFLCEKANRAGESWWGVRTAAEELAKRLGEIFDRKFVDRVRTWRRQLLSARLDGAPLVESYRREGMLTWTTKVLHRVRATRAAGGALSRKERAALRYDWRADLVRDRNGELVWRASRRRVAKVELRESLLAQGRPDPLRHGRAGAPGLPPGFVPSRVAPVTTERNGSGDSGTAGDRSRSSCDFELAPCASAGAPAYVREAHGSRPATPADRLSAPDGAQGGAASPHGDEKGAAIGAVDRHALRAAMVAAVLELLPDAQLPNPRDWSLAPPIADGAPALLVCNRQAARCRLALSPGWERVAANAASESGPIGAWMVRNGLNDWRP